MPTIRPISYFATRFVVGYKITEEDYQDWLVSVRSAADPVPLSDTTGLEVILANYRRLDTPVPFGDVAGLAAYIASQLSGYLPVNGTISISQVAGLTEVLAQLGSKVPAVRMTVPGNGNTLTHQLFNNRQATALLVNDIPKNTDMNITGTTLTVTGMSFRAGQIVTVILD